MITRALRIAMRPWLWTGVLTLALGAFGAEGAAAAAGGEGVSASDAPASPPKEAAPDGIPAADWAGIREAYEAGRHAARAVEGGYQAHNPGQRWRTRFDGRGFTTSPDAGGWTWGLQLESYGFVGREQEVMKPTRVRAEGGRVAYAWDPTLEEWYVNDHRGLEHGFTIHRRPPRDEGRGEDPLTLALAVRGTLHPEVMTGGRGVHFLDGEGAMVLTYAGLTVFDADGRELEAGFVRAGATLVLAVEEEGARYPLTIDPIVQQAYLKASTRTVPYAYFGWSVAAFGNTVVVGSYGEDSNATGVNGNEIDFSTPDAGAAYVFVRTGSGWSQQAYLKASNTNSYDMFGWSVAISGNTIVVTATGEDSSATGVGGNQSDNATNHSGAAYVFVRSGTSWSQQAYLKASNTGNSDAFGHGVAISGDTVVVSSYQEGSNATGVNGDQSDNSAYQAGAAYVFVRSGTSWSQQAYLKASNTDAGDYFGVSVAVSGDTVVVGAEAEDSGATGVSGNQLDNSMGEAGAAYVFMRGLTGWSQEAYLKASNTDAGDFFGHSVGIWGDTIVVAARYEDSSATGVNGNQLDNSMGEAGAAYVFMRGLTGWSQEAYLKASNTDAGDHFGVSVAVGDDAVVIGAHTECSSATGVNGNGADNSYFRAGAAYLFHRSGAQWSQGAYLKASNTDPEDYFGWRVAIAGDTVVVGAYGEDSFSTGVNGDQDDNTGGSYGAAYAFDLDLLADSSCASYCGTGVNSTTDGFQITSPAILGGYLDAVVTGCAPGNVGAFLVAYSSPLTFPTGWGEVLVNFADLNGELLGMPTALAIPAVFSLSVPYDPALGGLEIYTQAASFGGSICLHCAYHCVVGF